MSTFEMIVFLIIFIGIVIFTCRDTVKTEDEYEQKKKADRRQGLESENTEFDYGHNVNCKSNGDDEY